MISLRGGIQMIAPPQIPFPRSRSGMSWRWPVRVLNKKKVGWAHFKSRKSWTWLVKEFWARKKLAEHISCPNSREHGQSEFWRRKKTGWVHFKLIRKVMNMAGQRVLNKKKDWLTTFQIDTEALSWTEGQPRYFKERLTRLTEHVLRSSTWKLSKLQKVEESWMRKILSCWTENTD